MLTLRIIYVILVTMLRRGKKTVKRFAVDVSDSSSSLHHGDIEHMRMTNSDVSLESTVFGGESRITEQLESFEVVTSGFKVSSVTAVFCVSMSRRRIVGTP